MSDNEEFRLFDAEGLVDFVKSNEKINKISLRFSKEYQNEFQIDFFEFVKKKLPPQKQLFIIGDTSYGACCCDEVTALHLNSDIIVSVGSTCFTRNNKIPIYFLYKNLSFTEEEISQCINLLNDITTDNKNCFVFYNEQTQKFLVNAIRDKFPNIVFADIENDDFPVNKEKNDALLYGRNLHGKTITPDSIIVYIGKESDMIVDELSLRFVNKIKGIYVIDKDTLTKEQIAPTSVNTCLYRRFNLMEKAKQSNIFGILIGSLSLHNLNKIIEEIKATLSLNKKKYYTFLLGKITEEKLSNFTEYIDCFVLVACPFNGGYNNKALYKPIVSPLDIKIAFDKNFEWNSSYTFDASFIKNSLSDSEASKELQEEEKKAVAEMEKKCESLQVKDTQEALVPVFSVYTLENYDKRKFKGLNNNNEEKVEPQKAVKGKRGIPIRYENLK